MSEFKAPVDPPTAEQKQESDLIEVSKQTQGKTINIVFNWNGKNLFQFTASGVTLAAMLYLLKTLFDMAIEWSDHQRNLHQ